MLKTAARWDDAWCMQPNPRGGALQVEDSQDTDRQICCSMTSVLLRLVRAGGGEAAVTELLERSEIRHKATYLENADNWLSLDDACALLEAGIQQTGAPSFPRRVGEHTLRQHSGTQVATVLRSLGSTEAVLQAVAQT